MRRVIPATAPAVVLATAILVHAQAPAALDTAFAAFWAAGTPSAAGKVVDRIRASGASFEAIAARLRAGRPYTTRKTGRIELPTQLAGHTLDNAAEVPAEYDPARPMALRVTLHGGVGRPAPGPNESVRPLTNRIPGGPEIVLHPRSWADAEWWRASQVENVLGLVDRLKRAYNIDESHIYLTGISDGGTGTYYLAMKNATPWAACLPLNGQPLVIANPDTGAEGELYATNLANCPIHAVNGGRDRLYPAASVKPVIDMFQAGGIPVLWQVFPDADHNTEWWREEKARYMDFVAAHPRVAHPEHLTWTTERTDRDNRFRWLVIDRLGERQSDAALKDVNVLDMPGGRRMPLFARRKAAGRVDLNRRGNTVDATTRGVAAFTLLLSPDVIDFDTPVEVRVNGHTAYRGMVRRDVATLLEWAARDNDRTMLYAAELRIVVP